MSHQPHQSDAELNCLHSLICIYLSTTHIFFQKWKSNPQLEGTLGDSPVHSPNLIDVETQTQRREIIYRTPHSRVVTDLVWSLLYFLSFALLFIIQLSPYSLIKGKAHSESLVQIRLCCVFSRSHAQCLGLWALEPGWLCLIISLSVAGCGFL